MKSRKTLSTSIFVLFSILIFHPVHAQTQIKKQDLNRFFIGSSGFILVNAIPNQSNPPNFYQINYGYRLNNKDVISIEAITWKYNYPLGIPYGSSYEDPKEA